MRAVTLVALVALAACSSAPAQPTRFAIASPGMLAASHEHLACAACHAGGSGAVADAKCSACHDLVGNRGYHAGAAVRQLPCETCHRDHRGRSFDLRGWAAVAGGEAGFDHAITGWPLRGAHATACDACHARTDRQGLRIYAGTDGTCTACHAGAHAGQLFGTLPCTDCHAAAVATPTPEVPHPTFELGAHVTVPCLECHTQALGAALPDPVCHTCHVDDSPHGDRFAQFGPPACGACHRSASWHDIRFNHDLQTKFPLYPWHDRVACRTCHRGDSTTFERLPRKGGCKSCHAHARVHADDDHPNGRFSSKQCLLCHRYPGARGLRAE